MHRGFTLIELLVVVAIIGMLSSIVLSSLNQARENGRVANVLSQITQIRNATVQYVLDTNQYPVCRLTCDASDDPFLVANGVPGWNGPYFPNGVHALKHLWGGHFTVGKASFTYAQGLPSDLVQGREYAYFILDDDLSPSELDVGTIPYSAMLQIDEKIDDGNILTGRVQGYGGLTTAPEGELLILFPNI